ncbi:MAG: hypothetical protein HOF98_02275 [Gammaproteobacteria bacterium]|jgi:hypothetical protein|nr:hypothetical protein [Gammaproteobacteria bacterium]
MLFTLTMGSRKLSEQNGRLLKLLSGSMMLGLLLKPEWLSNMLVAVGVISGALLITSLAALIQKLRAQKR